MPRWSTIDVVEVPAVRGEPGDPAWHPLQHYFGITAFGANVFVAGARGQTLVGEHDEAASGQEELYLVLEGEAAFELDDETVVVRRGGAVAVTDPTVRRRATAGMPGTALLIVGVRPGCFETTWRSEHFSGLPRAH